MKFSTSKDIFNLSPDLQVQELVDALSVTKNDNVMVWYECSKFLFCNFSFCQVIFLSSIVRSIVALHSLISNKVAYVLFYSSSMWLSFLFYSSYYYYYYYWLLSLLLFTSKFDISDWESRARAQVGEWRERESDCSWERKNSEPISRSQNEEGRLVQNGYLFGVKKRVICTILGKYIISSLRFNNFVFSIITVHLKINSS